MASGRLLTLHPGGWARDASKHVVGKFASDQLGVRELVAFFRSTYAHMREETQRLDLIRDE